MPFKLLSPAAKAGLCKTLMSLACGWLLVACGTSGPYTLALMPAPDVYEPDTIDPFRDANPIASDGHPGMLYATNRLPAPEGDERYYTHERGGAMRIGMGRIELANNETARTWEEAKQIALLKNRTDDYPLQVTAIEEFGIHPRSLSPIAPESLRDGASQGAVDRFNNAINQRLALSRGKDVYIFVHGYKVSFDNPLLVASELWHYLGYNGAFVAYSWPTRESLMSYMADVENARSSARHLRMLLLDLADNPAVERIHVIGYSAGTRLVSRMLADLGQYAYGLEEEEIRARAKLDNVILIGSDVDQGILGGYLLDGALRVPEALTIYQSKGDSALAMSRLLFGQNRAGQTLAVTDVNAPGNRWLLEHQVLRIIDVSDAANADAGNGHGYLRSSPWVSSDILMTLLYDLPPEARGLEQTGGIGIWRFPKNYVERLRGTLRATNPRMFNEPFTTAAASASH